jgi:hypothetical protein
MLKRQGGRVHTGFMWLRVENCGGLLGATVIKKSFIKKG